MEEYLQVTTTVGNRDEADRIATALVERRQAACVQVLGPVRAVYRWQGAIEQADEWLCIVKTTRPGYAAVEQSIRELHSYECPEIVATRVDAGSRDYLAWLGEQVD